MGGLPVGLEYLSVFGLPVLDHAELAARLGCDFISLNGRGAANRLAPHPEERLFGNPVLQAALVRRVAELGLRVQLVEGFALLPEERGLPEADLDAAAALGAASICVIAMDRDPARTHDGLAAMAEAGAARGLMVTTEVGAGAIRDLATARAALAAVSHPGFRLLLDTMHLFRRGARVDDLAGLPSGAIGHVQLCDVPRVGTMASYMEEALFERCLPGEAELPLAAFLTALPAGVPVGLEIPSRSRFEAGVPLADTLARAVSLAREAIRAARC